MAEGFIRITEGGEGEIVEKKSRFIASVVPVATEEEAYAFIEGVKKKHYNARHNCFAFTVGEENPVLRFSDDGEPQGTAGKPILEVITGANLRNALIVVTRYFGGTLLGTGGLVRAYTDAAKEGLAAAKTHEVTEVYPCRVTVAYTDVGKLQHTLGGEEISIDDSVYAEDVTLSFLIPAEKKDRLVALLTEQTAGRLKLELDDPVYA